jgi:hypothetical protein
VIDVRYEVECFVVVLFNFLHRLVLIEIIMRKYKRARREIDKRYKI